MIIQDIEELIQKYQEEKKLLADEITLSIAYNKILDKKKINMVELNDKMYKLNRKIKQMNEDMYKLYATEKEALEKAKKGEFKVYLSGAIANDKDYVSKFMTAKSEVSDRGYNVLNPIETEESRYDKGVKECMFAAIALLRRADIMLLLDKQETIESKGVQIEKELARYCDIPVVSDYIELDRFYKCKFGENKKENKPYEEQEE